MANWSNPTNSSLYSDVLTNLKDRDVDVGTLFLSAPTNPVTGMIRFNRTTDLFEEYNGSTWVAQPISVAGGGTGATTPADARSNLGLGTLATQNSNAVAITGGAISGLTSLGVSGNVTVSGTITGTVPNASTTATSANTAGAIVARDASGNFSAGTITGTLNGTVTNGVVTTGSYSDPSWITALAATKLSGIIADARLSSNVPLENAANFFSGNNVFTGNNSFTDYSSNAEPLRKYALNYSGGIISLSAGVELEVFGAGSIDTLDTRGVNQILPPSTLGAQLLLAGNYIVSTHITFTSSNSEIVYRVRIVSYAASFSSPTQIIARAETYCKDAGKFIVLSCSGLVSTSSSVYIGVVVYADKAASVNSYATQANNVLAIARLG